MTFWCCDVKYELLASFLSLTYIRRIPTYGEIHVSLSQGSRDVETVHLFKFASEATQHGCPRTFKDAWALEHNALALSSVNDRENHKMKV